MPKPSRTPIPFDTQVSVLYEGNWLCHWCGRPVIFAPALKYLGRFVESKGVAGPLAYYDVRYRRDASPLLEELGLAIDHKEALAKGGKHARSNFVIACSACNAMKGDRSVEEFEKTHQRRTIKSKHGEPVYWDGLASYFIVVGREDPNALTPQEVKWLKALEAYLHDHPAVAAPHIGGTNARGAPAGDSPVVDVGGGFVDRLTDWSSSSIAITPPPGEPPAV